MGYYSNKQREKIPGILSVDFWFLLNIIFQKPADSAKKRGMINGESWWEMTSLMSPDECLKSPTTRGRYVCVCMLFFLSVCVCAWWKYQVNLRCCWTEEQTSGTLYSYHPIKYINIHVIWCPIVGQPYTTNFCFALPPLASLIRCAVK